MSDVWVDLTTTFSLVNGQTYLATIVAMPNRSQIYSATTDSAGTPPVGISGHPWENSAWSGLNASEHEQKPGRFLWARVSEGTATLAVTPL